MIDFFATPLWEQLGWGAMAVAAWMLLLWLLHFPLKNAAIVDFGWAIATGGLGVAYAIAAMQSSGATLRLMFLMLICGIWSLRLGLYLLVTRVIGAREEGRYQELRRQWAGGNIPLRFLMFFEFQALTCVLLSLPFLLAARNPAPELSVLEWVAVGVWAVGVLGESVADWQLSRWVADPAHRGKTFRGGLWRYSRHPNYFFEWLVWAGFGLFALAAPNGYWGLLSPALILYFILRVTGIPATEAQAVRSRGDDYRDYQNTTSAFLPWFPKDAEHQARKGAREGI